MMDVDILEKIASELVVTKERLPKFSTLELHAIVGLDEDLQALQDFDSPRRSCEDAGISLILVHEIGDPEYGI